MEPLMPSEIARLVYGYLKENKNNDAAEYFLKSSPYLTECYQMFKANRRFNLNVNSFKLLDILDLFGTMCSMINERTSEVCQSKTLIEKLQYLLDVNPMPIKEDKCIETELNMVDKCVGDDDEIDIKDNNLNIDTNKSTSEVLGNLSFNDMVSCSFSKTEEIDKISITSEKNKITQSSPYLSSTTQVINNNDCTPNFSTVEKNESCTIEFNEQNCSSPTKQMEESKSCAKETIKYSPGDIHNQFLFDQSKSQQIPETTSLESMPGLSKDEPNGSSVVIDTGELVDTFLNDKSLLEKIADTINKSMESQKKISDVDENKILNTTLEKALDSTQSDPQVKNILDEFLVFNVENRDANKKKIINNQQNSIKSRLRSAKKKGNTHIDDTSSKLKKNNLNTTKHIHPSNEDNGNIDQNIVLIHEGNLKTSIFEDYDLLSNQIVLQPNNSNTGQSFHLNKSGSQLEEDLSKINYLKVVPKMTTTLQTEDGLNKTNYVKIAPKMTPMLKTLQAPEICIFPKRKKRSLDEFTIVRSQFKKGSIAFVQPPNELIQPTQSIIIEVPNQSSFENQVDTKKNNVKLPDMSKVSLKDAVPLNDTPDDRVKPPKNRSLSTPRRRSTHIRCLDFSTPQPKNNDRDQARSKLLFDTPKKCETILEEPSPLPKLQADWGSVNGFESIVRKETTTDWDKDIRDMVGAGVLTSDADGRKMRKKKIPRKKIKPLNDKIISENLLVEQSESNNLNQINELQIDGTIKSNVSENVCDVNKQNCIDPLQNEEKSSKDQSEFSMTLKIADEVTELCNEQLSNKSNSLNNLVNDSNLLKTQSEFPISLETPDKVTKLCKKQLPIKSNLSNSVNESKLLKTQNEFSISLETPDKVTELYKEQLPIASNFLNSINDSKLLKTQNELPTSLETPDKITELYKEQLSIKSNFSNNVNDSKLLKTQSEFPISLETPDKVTELYKTEIPIKSDSLKGYNNEKSLDKFIEFPIISLETPDKATELYKEHPPIKSDSSKSFTDKNSLEKQSDELSISIETHDKIGELYNKQSSFESDSLKNYTIQNSIEQPEINIKKQENNLNNLDEKNKLTTTFNSKVVNSSDLTNKSQEKNSKCLEKLNDLHYLKPLTIEQPENKSNEPSKNVKIPGLVDLNVTNNSSKLHSPVQVVQVQPNEHNLIETPYKCDDAAVDVPETPISKLLREYDPSKLVTPLHSTPYHYDDSLTETPLTKVFRETSYLNRPQISPFPPTPGNSRSVDTLFVPLDQDCAKTSINMCDKINNLKDYFTQPNQTTDINEPSIKKTKVKVKPSASIIKPKLSNRNKIKTDLKGKTIEAKISQVYESVKVDLFGSEISSSLSDDELVKIKEHPKKSTINKKQEKMSGFKPIPKRKSLQSTSIAINECHLLNESDPKLNKPCIKSTSEHNVKSSSETSKNVLKITQSNKIKKPMVHFDDPVEKSYISTNIVPSKSNTIIKSNEIENKNITNEKSENLIELSRSINKPTKFVENNSNEIKINTMEPEKKNSISKYRSPIIKNSKNVNESIEDLSKTSSNFLNISKTQNISNQSSIPSANCSIDRNKKFDKQENNTTFNKSNTSIESMLSINTRTSDEYSISKKMINTSPDKSNQLESHSISYNKSKNNISFISVIHNDEISPDMKLDDQINSLEYLKKSKAFEVTTDDSKQMVGYLNLSNFITLFSLKASNNDVRLSNTITSPLITNKRINVTHEKEAGELEDDDDMHIPITSTPKDAAVKKIEDKQSRERRSPSFWEDSVHINYRSKYKDDRHKESTRWQNKNYRDRYYKKYWPNKSRYNNGRLQFDSNSRFHYVNIKREFRDEERIKHKEDRRSYRDYNYDKRKGRDRLEDLKRILPNDSQNWPRSEENFKKAMKRPADRTDYYKTPTKVSKVEHQRLLRNVDVDDFLSVVHGKK